RSKSLFLLYMFFISTLLNLFFYAVIGFFCCNFFHMMFVLKFQSSQLTRQEFSKRLQNTVKPAYNDSADSDTPLITTLFPAPLSVISRKLTSREATLRL